MSTEGPNLILRLIAIDDAAYVHSLRTDPSYSRYLSSAHGTVDDQRRWIESYKCREAAGQELYYVIQRRNGQRCGLVRLYDIGSHAFTWGSWILDKNKPPKAALESALLSFSIGFKILGLEKALVDVRIDNIQALRFYSRLGMRETRKDSRDIFFEYSRVQFDVDESLMALVKSDDDK